MVGRPSFTRSGYLQRDVGLMQMNLDVLDRPFYVVILDGYGVVGIYIVVLGHSDRMFGCLGNLVMCLPPRWWRQAAPQGELAVFVSEAHRSKY